MRPSVALATLISASALVVSGTYAVQNADTFGHLAQGRQIVELGHVPKVDTFSVWQATPAPWCNYEWLSDLIGYATYAAAGFNGLLVLKATALALLAFFLVILSAAQLGARAAWACSALLVMSTVASRFRLSARPHVAGLPLAALCLCLCGHLLGGVGRRTRASSVACVLSLGALQVLWVNLHGSHLLGLAITSICLACGALQVKTSAGPQPAPPRAAPERASVAPTFAGSAERPAVLALSSALGLQLGACAVSPYGARIVIDAVDHVFDPAYRDLVSEWSPWTGSEPLWLFGAPTLHTLLLALSVRPLLRRGALGWALLGTGFMLAFAAFRSVRFVAEYLLLTAPAVAVGLSVWTWAWPRPVRASLVAAPMLATALMSPWTNRALPPQAPFGHGVNLAHMPAATLDWLARRAVAPRLLARVDDSWYALFAVPQVRVLVDGRIPFYGPAHIARVLAAVADPARLEALLEQYGIDAVLVRYTVRDERALVQAMQAQPDYLLAAIEDRYALFVRADLQTRDGRAPQALPLPVSYQADAVLAADASSRSLLREGLARLSDHPNTRGYRAFIEGMLGLQPLLRGSPHDGVRAPRTAAERETLARIEARLSLAAARAEQVPILHAYDGLVAAVLCNFDAAQAALARAAIDGPSRETLLGAQEVAVRRGEHERVRAFLEQAASLPGAASDRWLQAIEAELTTPPPCP